MYRRVGKSGRSVRRAEKYSGEVQQRHWLRQGFLAFERPDPCSDEPGRPPCPEFATRGQRFEYPPPNRYATRVAFAASLWADFRQWPLSDSSGTGIFPEIDRFRCQQNEVFSGGVFDESVPAAAGP
jgi:hypothetical protein